MFDQSRARSGAIRNVITERLQKNGSILEEFYYAADGRLTDYIYRAPDGYEFRRKPVYDEDGCEIAAGTRR